jgi:hypothetical protein
VHHAHGRPMMAQKPHLNDRDGTKSASGCPEIQTAPSANPGSRMKIASVTLTRNTCRIDGAKP